MNNVSLDRLFNLRWKKGLTQIDVAYYLCISRVTYCYYENGHRSIPLHIYWKLADLYNVSIDYLVGRSDNSNCNI